MLEKHIRGLGLFNCAYAVLVWLLWSIVTLNPSDSNRLTDFLTISVFQRNSKKSAPGSL